jgi:pilus assembly protein CpaB
MKLTEKFRAMRMENKLLLLAVVCGVTAALLGYFFLANKEEEVLSSMKPVKVFVASKFITPRSQIKEDMVQFVEMPSKFVTSANVSSFEKLKGKMTIVPFIEGEPILLNKLSAKAEELSSAVPTGLRAVGVAVDEESSVSYLIKPGDYVDVLLTFETSEGKKVYTVTATILQSVQVISTGTNFTNGDADIKGYNSITLALSPEESEILAFSREKGRLTFALRGVGDTVKEKLKLTSFSELVKQIKANEKGDEDIKKQLINSSAVETGEKNTDTSIQKREE